MLSSLDVVAQVTRRRTDAAEDARLRAWAVSEKASFLAAYRAELDARGRDGSLDERLLGPFVIEQLCRELLYAASVLPRWRYAPLGALRWLLPDEAAPP